MVENLILQHTFSCWEISDDGGAGRVGRVFWLNFLTIEYLYSLWCSRNPLLPYSDLALCCTITQYTCEWYFWTPPSPSAPLLYCKNSWITDGAEEKNPPFRFVIELKNLSRQGLTRGRQVHFWGIFLGSKSCFPFSRRSACLFLVLFCNLSGYFKWVELNYKHTKNVEFFRLSITQS